MKEDTVKCFGDSVVGYGTGIGKLVKVDSSSKRCASYRHPFRTTHDTPDCVALNTNVIRFKHVNTGTVPQNQAGILDQVIFNKAAFVHYNSIKTGSTYGIAADVCANSGYYSTVRRDGQRNNIFVIENHTRVRN